MTTTRPERVRFLNWTGRKGGDYTDEFWKSMRDEPEPVDDDWLKEFGKRAEGSD